VHTECRNEGVHGHVSKRKAPARTQTGFHVMVNRHEQLATDNEMVPADVEWEAAFVSGAGTCRNQDPFEGLTAPQGKG
jgi:hypothetical protein